MGKFGVFTFVRTKLLLRSEIKRYVRNPYLKCLEKTANNKFPFEMLFPMQMPFIEFRGCFFLCLGENNVTYVMITDVSGELHLILALENGDVKRGIGFLYYRIEPSNGNIALKGFQVHENYARCGVGKNLLFSMMRAEHRLLRTSNVYVQAAAITYSDKYLSQKELENYYENHGFVLCSNCYGGAYNGVSPRKQIRKNLLYQINQALTKGINHME